MIIWSKKLMSMAILAMLSTTSADVFAANTVHNGDGTEEEMPTYSLGDTIVTATRLRKRDVNVPASTMIITAQEIKDSGAASAAAVLQKVNGFAYKSFGPNGSSIGSTNELNVRGFRGGMLVLMNGSPISWRGKYNLEAIPSSRIERVEIVKGSGSVLYGSEAVSGVVNIITKKTAENAVYAGFGNYGQQEYGVSVGDDRLGVYYNYSKWGHRNGASYTSVNATHFKGETRTDIRDIERQNVGLSYRVNPHLNFLLDYYETEDTYQRSISNVRSSTQGLRVGEPYYVRNYAVKRYMTQLNYNDRDWRGRVYFNTGTSETAGPVYISGTGMRSLPSQGRYQKYEKNMTYGIDLQRAWKMGKAEAIVGMNLEREDYHELPAFSTRQEKRYARNNWGVFGQWEQRFDSRNTGIFGLRETWTTGAVKEQNYHNLSASAQWLHKLDHNSSVYLNVSQSFVMPTFAQMYAENASLIPSPNLKPQTGINYELGWKQERDGHIWKAALFHMRVKDKITAKWAGSAYQYTNEDFRNTGIELSNEIRGSRGLSYQWGLTWQNPETRSSDNTFGWNRAFGKVQITGGIVYKKGKWTSAFNGSYLASRVKSPTYMPAYRTKPYLLTTWNTVYAPDSSSEISFTVENVLNRDDVTTHTDSNYYVAPISYMLSYRYAF